MERMHKSIKNGENLLKNCMKLACVLEYLQTRGAQIDDEEIDANNLFQVTDQAASELGKEEVDRELLIEKIWPKYQNLYNNFLGSVNKNVQEQADMEPK